MTSPIFSVLLICFINSVISWPFVWRRDVGNNDLEGSNELLTHLGHLEETMFGVPSNETGAKVAGWSEDLGINPEEMGEYAEGDILFPVGLSRNGLLAQSSRWPEGVIPYMISPYFNANQKALIMDAMNDYHENTCIRFIPYAGVQSDYIRITAGNTGCWSSVGRIGGAQDVNLQVPGCVTKKGTVIHELMHAVGFLHEQSRFERDQFVSINWQNIMPGRAGNFDKASKGTTDGFGVGYDYGSVMHYSGNAFSVNGRPTIVPKEGNGLLDLIGEVFQGRTNIMLGQREGFSRRDIQKIRRMYRCSKRRRSNN
ncbi:zinc metalloproteinase nas-13-like [Diachasmimorpha longicaudata]|uniref:zinc metalloproteinase nas-13-like n=1 Tax=Diachasmimorpha longicaudata TaxID=58733 RepID=UPI0030B8BCA8